MTSFTTRLAVTAGLCLAVAACGDQGADYYVDTTPTAPRSQLALASATGCYLDSDCHDGLFCFQSQCTWECDSDADCADGGRCSDRGRCVDTAREADREATGARLVLDEESVAQLATQLPTIEVLELPENEVHVDAGQPFVEVTLRTDRPVPGGALLYRVELDGQDGAPRTMRAEGTTTFTFVIPTGRAGSQDAEPAVQRAYLVTPLGGYAVTLVPRISLDGLYAGEVAIREFGGSGIPIRFGLRLEPEGARFEDATARYLLLPASAQDVFSPVHEASVTGRWIERPLEWDAEGDVWFARVASPYTMTAASQFAGSGAVVRALRVEIASIEGRRVEGALADRWQGLYDARTADGVVAPGQVVLSGSMFASRVGRLPAAAYAATTGTPTTTAPPIGEVLVVDACPAPLFQSLVQAVRPVPEEGEELEPDATCFGVNTFADFELASSVQRADCALAIADHALSGPSTAAQIRAFLDDSIPNPGGLSFADFLDRCAAQQGYCVPSAEMLCAGQLVAYSYQVQSNELAAAGELLGAFQELAREGYLGRQLAAFQVDTTTRLEWLRTSIAPLFLASELRAYNEDILARWESRVLNAHFDVLARQFAPAGLEVLARAPTDTVAQSVRRQMLLEQTQTWQGAMEALQIATQRWNSVFQNDARRATAATSVRTRMFDLYLSAAVLAQLNRSSGSAGNNAVFGSGFAALLRSLEELSLPFSDLLFMRDAEVVVSRSVDPQSDSRTLLGELEELARRAVDDAQESVDRVLADASANEINAQVLTDRMRGQVEELRSELISLCGLPRGCAPSDVGLRPECAVQTHVGRCGLVINAGGGYESFDAIRSQESVSEAGSAILRYRQAMIDVRIAEEEYRANEERARIEMENAEAFARNLESWNQRRRQTWAEIDALLDEVGDLEGAIAEAELDVMRNTQTIRASAYARQQQSVESWAKIRYEGVESDMRRMTTINALQQTSNWLSGAADETDRLAEIIADGMPKAVGLANDFSAPARLVMGLSTFGVTTALRVVAQSLETAADTIGVTLAEEQARRDATLSELADLADLDAAFDELQLEAFAANLRRFEMRVEDEIGTREALIDALRRSLELDLAYERDLVELRDRRDRARLRLTDSARLRVQVLRAEVVATQRHQEYMQVVQRAQLLEGRYGSLNERLNNLDVLLGSPSVIFAFANRLARAESRVERAKRLLYDWLVALEYYAVRPFIDQRLAIMLARNPSQLEAIANELVRLERVCGGIVNYEVADLSLRDDLLGIGFDLLEGGGEAGTGIGVVDATTRFRAVLRRGNVPIDTRVRYSSDERIGDLIASRPVLAATFALRLDDFANLPQTCNAKIASIGVQLVGEGLGDNVQPAVSVLYDGTSTLRSCQANIDAIVGGLDPGSTNFGRLTGFRTSGRSVTPVARVNDYGPVDSDNRGLEGLPLASTYTVLIDPTAGDNRFVTWERLEDIRLRVTYVYQDVFPMGQCE